MMQSILKPTLIIVAIAFVCVIILSQVQKLTAPTIAARAKEKQGQALGLVLPGFDMGEARTARIDGKDFTWWQGVKEADGAVLKGYAFITKSAGYGGDIESMVGVDETGVILGLSVISQSETPGLGDRCVEVASRETLWDHIRGGIPFRDFGDDTRIPWFQNQFKGVNAGTRIAIARRGDWSPDMRENLLEMNAISALTGASITTATVVRSVEDGMALLVKARKEMQESAETKK
jgi:Na+-translocating ferredoxin:NAD+ oxidoreductase subunit G